MEMNCSKFGTFYRFVVLEAAGGYCNLPYLLCIERFKKRHGPAADLQ